MSIMLLFIIIVSTLLRLIRSNLPHVPENEHNPFLQVTISNGKLQGLNISSGIENEFYYAFFGIPYAEPPIDNLRFRPPQPPSNWSGVLDVRRERSKCMQPFDGSEDCLYINVCTPYTETLRRNRSLLPVMVWIHGGGFIYGAPTFELYGPDHLLKHGVVYVSLTYRLGIFGFLNTEDMISPGNYGLKDQIAALKWVQRNIHHFGGDPSRVTIFGESAGAASVHYLLQAPQANGLFQGAISQSGSSLCAWAFTRNPKKIAFEIGTAVGVFANDTEELVEKLRDVDSQMLNEAVTFLMFEDISALYDGLPFSPSIEPDHKDAVLLMGSYEILSSNQYVKVPLLTGFNSLECGKRIDSIPKSIFLAKILLSSGFVHKNLNVSDPLKKLKIGNEIKAFYFKKELEKAVSYESTADFLSDDMFVRPIRETAKLMSKSIPVYVYRFSYETDRDANGQNITRGVPHSEDLRYIFFARNADLFEASPFIQEKIIKMWTNFAKIGNPTPAPDELLDNITWPTVSFINEENFELRFLNIDSSLTNELNPRKEAMEMWDGLYKNCCYSPFDTY